MTGRLGPMLRRALVGYWSRLDAELRAAGFEDRRFPDERVLRICVRDSHVTVAHIGRELGITRQGAGKVVARLSEGGYVTLAPSPGDAREKVVTLTDRATDFLTARRAAARKIEEQLLTELGEDALDALGRLLACLGKGEQPSMADYLRATSDVGALADAEE